MSTLIPSSGADILVCPKKPSRPSVAFRKRTPRLDSFHPSSLIPHPFPRHLYRPGYVLVTVLALLVLSATLMVAVSRAALRHAAAARVAQDDLQHRWGVVSCRRAVLIHADQLLAIANLSPGRNNLARLNASIQLGNQSFDLIVSDEQAKANINALLEEADSARVESRLRQSLSGTGLLNAVRLRPTAGPIFLPTPDDPSAPPSASVPPPDPKMAEAGPPPTTAPAPPIQTSLLRTATAPRVAGLGQVFEGVAPAKWLRPSPGSNYAAIDLITLWGTGAVNIRRTSIPALTLASGKALDQSEISRLLTARDALIRARAGAASAKSPADEFKRQLQSVSASAVKNRANFAAIEFSQCHSLWIITRTKNRDWYDLSVLDQSNAKISESYNYSW